MELKKTRLVLELSGTTPYCFSQTYVAISHLQSISIKGASIQGEHILKPFALDRNVQGERPGCLCSLLAWCQVHLKTLGDGCSRDSPNEDKEYLFAFSTSVLS